jgi:hypothetical protein
VTARLLLGILLAFYGLLAQSATARISPVFARHGVHAVAAATPDGKAEIAAKIGSEVMNSMGDLGAHMAMIRNDSSNTIMSVIWIWTGVTPGGRRAPMIGQSVGASLEGVRRSEFLVSAPSFPLSQMLMQRAQDRGVKMSALASALTDLRNAFARFTVVEASLDSVVLDNATVLGPDEYGVIESRRASAVALAEISATLNDFSKSDAEVDAWLQEIGQRAFTLKPNGLPDHSSGIGSAARGVRLQIAQHGRAKIARLLAEVTKKNAAANHQFVQVKE